MNVLTRSAVGAYVKALRLPFDAGTRLLGTDADSGRRATAGLAIDQVEVSVLGAVGQLFDDAELQANATLRATAIDERRAALRLRERAANVSEDGAERAERKEQHADARRARATEQTKRRRTQAAKTEHDRRRASAKAAAAQRDAIDKRAKAERLDALDTKAKALAEKEKALAAKAESQRLGEAAARTKAKRKTAGSGTAR